MSVLFSLYAPSSRRERSRLVRCPCTRRDPHHPLTRRCRTSRPRVWRYRDIHRGRLEAALQHPGRADLQKSDIRDARKPTIHISSLKLLGPKHIPTPRTLLTYAMSFSGHSAHLQGLSSAPPVPRIMITPADAQHGYLVAAPVRAMLCCAGWTLGD